MIEKGENPYSHAKEKKEETYFFPTDVLHFP